MILKVAIPIPLPRLFDYLAPENSAVNALKPGIRVLVPFGRSKKIAFLIECVEGDETDSRLKRVEACLDSEALLSASDMRLLAWVSRYYHYPLGEVYSMAVPALLRQGKAAILPVEACYALTELGKTTDSQQLQRAPKQKALLELFQTQALPLSLLALKAWQANWRMALKPLLEKQLLQSVVFEPNVSKPNTLLASPILEANPQQQAAIDRICRQLGHFGVFLLHGITGSGKTEVYLQIIYTVLQQGGQVLVLVPEITLTPQLEARFRERFSVPIAVSHSKLTDNERYRAWLTVQQGRSAIMLGTRSALFTPLKNPALIILDEEHDASFKQQEGCRFSARDIAVVRGKMLGIPVVLGSATPSLESLHNVDKGSYDLLTLSYRAGLARAPSYLLLDIRGKQLREGLSAILIAEMKATLAKNEQVLLFLNRRGFAPTLICHDCGWIARCSQCDTNLVIHAQDKRLRCHHCGAEKKLMECCEGCKTGRLMPLGLGTERIEQALGYLFPDKTIVRLDRDSTKRKGSLQSYLSAINQGKADIILGTQMLAKGHHFSQVTLVAMLDVDSGLFSVDFHAIERLAQLIVQVSGRAGRETMPGKVILQTRQPEHPLLTTLIQQGYSVFAKQALLERNSAQLPPFSHQALLRVRAYDADIARLFLQEVMALAQRLFEQKAVIPSQILGPVPAPMERRGGWYRYQVLFQNKTRKPLHQLLTLLLPEIYQITFKNKLFWSLDIDPIDLF